jgi:hypothetical protein
VGTVNTSNGKRNTLPWFLALRLLSLAVLFRLAGQAIADPARSASTAAVDSHHGSGEATRPIASARRQTAPPAARGHGVSGHLNPDGYLLPGDDFSAIERRLAERVTYDERALFVMYHAAGVCSTPVKPEWRKTARSESGRTFSAWKESFCHGITTHDEFRAYAAMTQRTPALGCQAGASLDDLWANEFAPDEIAIIARIQQRILDERSRRLATGASTAPRDAAR